MIALLRSYLDDIHGDKWKPEKCLETLSMAQQELANLAEESFADLTQGCANLTVVASDNDRYEFTLPADFTRLERAEKVVSGGRAVPATHVDFFDAESGKTAFDVFYALGTSSNPVVYIRGNKLGVVFPGEAYTLRIFYLRSLTELDDPNDVSEIPASFHSLVVLHATALGKAQEGRGGLTPDQRVIYDRQMAAFLGHAMHRNARLHQTVTYVEH